MSRLGQRLARSLAAVLLFVCAAGLRAEYLPQAERVAENVYAIVGPLGQRSADNDGLNANYGVVVTAAGTVLIDSGASRLGAEKIERAIRAVTDRPVRWVVNLGGQDHRWLGNAYFAARGAETMALARTAATQAEQAAAQMGSLERFLGPRLAGTTPMPATRLIDGDEAVLELGGERLVLSYTDAHYPGDAMLYLPRHGIVFGGDLIYVDRLVGILPRSSVKHAQRAFAAMAALAPRRIVPGHGRVCDLAQARRESGDYYDFLVNVVGAAAREMEPMDAVLSRHADLAAFRHLANYGELHRANMNRTFTEFERD